ncbi:MAG: pseudouridine-5'-phosphate glycosidase, partial [Acidimicrobiales bacterium]
QAGPGLYAAAMVDNVEVHPEVADALAEHRPVVALESTIFSHLGLPSPHNTTALSACVDAIRAEGAVPAITAVLAGRAHVGLEAHNHELILGPAHKTSSRDLGVALAQRWPVGATTVSASLVLAATAGISVFATGGIGGVHIGAEQSFDVSADLGAIADHRVVTVCAGPKYFLDLPATLEVLESAAVPVLGYGCDELPAFYSPWSGCSLTTRVESATEVAAVATAHWSLAGGGVLTTVPIPAAAAIERTELDGILTTALERAAREGLRGAAITPVILAETARLSEGRSVTANLALAENNARVAAQIAGALSSRSG